MWRLLSNAYGPARAPLRRTLPCKEREREGERRAPGGSWRWIGFLAHFRAQSRRGFGEAATTAVHLRVILPKRGHSLHCVADRGMIPPVIEPADPCRAPPSHVLGKVHCDLTIECGWLRVSFDTRLTESRCDHYCQSSPGKCAEPIAPMIFHAQTFSPPDAAIAVAGATISRTPSAMIRGESQ